MRDWLEDHMGYLIIVLLIILVSAFGILVIKALTAESKQHKKFMQDCLKDHKEYECVAMWRAGNTNIAPSPVIIMPMGTL